MIGTEGNRAELGLQSISSISRAKIKIDKFHSESIFNWKMTLLFLAELLRNKAASPTFTWGKVHFPGPISYEGVGKYEVNIVILVGIAYIKHIYNFILKLSFRILDIVLCSSSVFRFSNSGSCERGRMSL